jgi:hypothetical protein
MRATKFLPLLLCALACSKGSKKQDVQFDLSQITGSSVMMAVIGKDASGNVEVKENTDFVAPDELSFTGDVANDPEALIVLLSFAEDVSGESPKFIPEGESTTGYRYINPDIVFYTKLGSGEAPIELTQLDANSVLVNEMVNMLYVAVDPTLADTDEDGDGSTADIDCDDSDPEVYPDAPELYDGKDNDCDRDIDETLNPTVTAQITASGREEVDIDDDVIDPDNQDAVWLSGGNVPVTIEFEWPIDVNVKQIDIWWGYNDAGTKIMTAKDVEVQYDNGSTYVTVSHILWNGGAPAPDVSSVTFAPVTTRKIRLLMSAGNGNPDEQNLLRLTEVNYTLVWP